VYFVAGLRPGEEMYCEGCERSVPIRLRTATQAECSICKELVFDAEAEAALPIDGDEGEATHASIHMRERISVCVCAYL
jgi:hypothetical protein